MRAASAKVAPPLVPLTVAQYHEMIRAGIIAEGAATELIDGLLVNGSAALARGFGWMGSRLQTGNVGIYAWVLVVGVVVLLGAFTLR